VRLRLTEDEHGFRLEMTDDGRGGAAVDATTRRITALCRADP
jgi:signal transduction histidine kinase